MGRLRVLSGREVCRILSNHGFVEVRRRGSHIVMQRRTEGGTTTVPVPDHRELKIGTLAAIIRRFQPSSAAAAAGLSQLMPAVRSGAARRRYWCSPAPV